ncbi:MAG: hypothetical protein IJM92_16960 [Fibrobacter sp.]|uniref:PLAT/LH2 domain-containing protein n=1 Tax=Fibrobacter sp. TaxID=35828 RepID=UPI0025C62A16|nr:PLAT/LH2 domain-containing protein [Fibrobacter sp.]MBQ7081311.1 hypothetical protein [Fibrobacter sp.]
MTTYTIRIVTGSVKNAGTDANVYLKAEGTNASIKWNNLNDPNDSNDFEKGDVNVINVASSVDLGDIKKITIGHDNKGAGAGWYLNNVQITNTTTGQKWFFTVNRWIAKDEADRKLYVTMAPTSVTPGNTSGSSSGSAVNPNSQDGLIKKIDNWYKSKTNCAWSGIPKKNIADGLKEIVKLYFDKTKKYSLFRVCDGNSHADYQTGIDQGSGFSICGPVAAMFYMAKLGMAGFIDVITTLYEYGTLMTYRVPERLRTLKDNDKIKNRYKCSPTVVADVCWMFQASLAQKEAVASVDFDSSFLTVHTRPAEMSADVKFLFNIKSVLRQSLANWSSVAKAKTNLKEWVSYLNKSGTVFWCMHGTALKNLRGGRNDSYTHTGVSDLHWVVVLRVQSSSNSVTVDLHSWGCLYRITVSYEEFRKMSYDAVLFKA